VACVLAEPVMTNIGMVLPQPGYWEAAQKIIRRHGTMLVLDETITLWQWGGIALLVAALACVMLGGRVTRR